MKKMVSFIVIGRNEGWKLAKCFSGIRKIIAENFLEKYEIIYVDSNSEDNSIIIAQKNKADIILKIRGKTNAAIARNTGAKEAKGEIFVFLDGDIELMPFDFSVIINSENHLKYPYVAGFLDDVNYSSSWKYLDQAPRSYKTEIKDMSVTMVGGGIFIIEKKTWLNYYGMDERLKRTEDRDLTLRMAKDGIIGIRKSEIFGLHHTIPYNENKRMWEMLFNGSLNYKGVFIRKHLFNSSYYKKFIREEWTLIVLILCLLAILISYVNPIVILIYMFAIMFKIRRHVRNIRFISLYIHRILQDIFVALSILIFFPAKPKYSVDKVH